MITPLKNNILIEVYKASSVFEMLDENQTEKGKVLAVGPLVDSVNKGVCKTCKKKLVTKKGNRGRIDNAKWLKEHAADFAQPTGRTAKLFKQIYGSR